jgi:hypothetical protein
MLGPPHVWVVLDLVLLLGLARDPVQVPVGFLTCLDGCCAFTRQNLSVGYFTFSQATPSSTGWHIP